MLAPEALLLHLSEFKPSRPKASAASWEALTQLAPMHGLAPLIAYNLEYRLGGAGAPQVVRDVLLSHYQGSLADNVFKFVNLKKALAECADAPVILLDAAAFADSLYPHVAFRPASELRLLVQQADLEKVKHGLGAAGYGPTPDPDPLGGLAVLTDERTRIVLHTRLFPDARAAEETGLWQRALPSRAMGVHARRPAPEDALLSAVLLQARQAFDVPLIQTLDLRELVRGAPDLGGPYSQPLDVPLVLARARALKLERALWTAMELVGALYPVDRERAQKLQPPIRGASQALLRKLVVAPLQDLARTSAPRGLDRLRVLLAGG